MRGVANDWSKRKDLLAVGRYYCAAQDARAYPGLSFKIGERLRLTHVGYSPYDNAYVYTFEADDGGQKAYMLSDSDPPQGVTDTFKQL